MLGASEPGQLVAATDTAALLVQLLLGGFGVTAVAGAAVAVFKLRPDVNSAAVVQAQGAMGTMQLLNESLAKENSHLRELVSLADARSDECERDVVAMRREVLALRDALADCERRTVRPGA